MSLPFPTVILFSILPRRSLFPKPTPLTQVRIQLCHNLACSLLPLLTSPPSQHFPSNPITLQSYAQRLKSWHREDHARGHCCNLAVQMIELEALAWLCLSVLIRLNQSCNFLRSFSSLLPFPSGILTIHSTPLLPTSTSCSRDAGCGIGEATAQPPWLVTWIHYQWTDKIRGSVLGDANIYRIFLQGKNKKMQVLGS